MSYVIIKSAQDELGEHWDITFEGGATLFADKVEWQDAFSVVDNYCNENSLPLPTEWRYE